MKKAFIILLLLCIFNIQYVLCQKINFEDSTLAYTQQKTITTKNFAVVSAHPLASMVGQQILLMGGNAFDAAIAMQFALAVVYPQAGNIGGGGFMIACLSNGKKLALDYREKAPGGASRDMYLNAEGIPLLEKSQNGHLAAGVPGTVAGIFEILPYAKLPISTLIKPAITLAAKGYAITDSEASLLNSIQEELKNYNMHTTAFQKNNAWKQGDILIQQQLANTLQQIASNGKAGFYEGVTANLIVEEMKKGGGIISLEDLKKYKATWRNPLSFKYKDYEIVSMPPPSSGGVILQQLLTMSNLLGLHRYPFQSIEAVNIMTEAERRSFADRADYLGDPDFVRIPLKTLTSKVYLQKRLADFSLLKASNSKKVKAGIVHQSEETTHLNIVDTEGNAVAITTTLNGLYGSRTVVSGAGFFLNNEMDDFSIKPGTPNLYGAIGGEANSIAPCKTMLSSMTPTIVLSHNKVKYVMGTPGGTTIPTSVYQTIVNLIDFKLTPTEAIWKPKFHHQWLPDEIFVEKNISTLLIEKLKKIGYKISVRGDIGRTELIVINKNGTKTAIADIRGDDDARGN